MQYRPTLPGQLSEEGESDHALAAAGTAGHDDSRLGVPPVSPVNGKIISLYGDALSAGSNQIVSINRGARDGLERGTVLALWHEGAVTRDTTVEHGKAMKLPDERIGVVFVFRVFDRMAYGLVLDTTIPSLPGDRVTQP